MLEAINTCCCYVNCYDRLKIQESSINQKPTVMLCTEVTFVKKSSCLVGRIVSFGTAGLHLHTFRILEPYSSKDIELGLSHFISHYWRCYSTFQLNLI